MRNVVHTLSVVNPDYTFCDHNFVKSAAGPDPWSADRSLDLRGVDAGYARYGFPIPVIRMPVPATR